MATPMIGYDVSYERLAFRTKIDPEGLPWGPLESLLERAARFVQTQSDGRWIISRKAEFVSSNKDVPVELMVIVPAGSDQYTQFLEAVKLFEERIVTYPFLQPIDTTLRVIEEGGPKCDDCESRTIDWIRTTPYAGNERYFCNKHAERQSDFGGNAATNPDNFLYVRQHPHRVRIDT